MTSANTSPELSAWLKKIELQHPSEIELDLVRVEQVARNADLLAIQKPIITVSGTNGKGSVAAFLTALYIAAGHTVGTYTSPHLLRYNERISINAEAVSDDRIVNALAAIDFACAEIPLTYFEYSTLAAMKIFMHSAVDIIVLEVGLGGRLDAVNCWDANVAIVTSIAEDHQSWLGSSRELIAVEKVGIARNACPLVIGDRHPPLSLLRQASIIGARSYCIQKDFDYSLHEDVWDLQIQGVHYLNLPKPALKGPWQLDNASTAIMAATFLHEQFVINNEHIHKALLSVKLIGRFDCRDYENKKIILDVGHNPAAVKFLTQQLHKDFPGGINVVFAVMGDKAVDQMIMLISSLVNTWYLGDLDVSRAISANELGNKIMSHNKGACIKRKDTVAEAFKLAVKSSNNLPIVVFGSFYTITKVLELFG